MSQGLSRTKCPGDQILIGHAVLMMQKTNRAPDLRETVYGCEPEKFQLTSLTVSPGAAAVGWFLITKLLSVQLYSLQSTMRFDHAYTWPLQLSALQPKHGVPTVWMLLSTCCMFCADPRLEYDGSAYSRLECGRKTKAGLSAAS